MREGFTQIKYKDNSPDFNPAESAGHLRKCFLIELCPCCSLSRAAISVLKGSGKDRLYSAVH